MNRYLAVIPLFAALLSCSAEPATPRSGTSDAHLSEATAIARTEEFVRLNGYVDASDADPRPASPESLELGGSVEERLAHRAGTLLLPACGVLRHARDAWVVAFCYDPRHFEPDPHLAKYVRAVGRGVVIADDGRAPQIGHQDLKLDSPNVEKRSGMNELTRILRTLGIAEDEKR